MNARTRTSSIAASRHLRRLVLSSVLLVGAALAWTVAHAQGQPPVTAQPTSDAASKMRLSSAQVLQAFRSIDRDGNGSLSRSEIAVYPRVEKHFDRIDSDHDGSVSPAEFENAVQQAS